MKILVLGHKGLLGNCVFKRLSGQKGLQLHTTEERWPDNGFIDFVKGASFDWVINAIAKIPQSNCPDIDYYTVNVGLPVFLSALNFSVIHPSSNLLNDSSGYSLSKLCAEEVLVNFQNTYIIRSSIIGIEEGSNKSLLSWFLSVDKDSVDGYQNHYWNGITTLQWSEICLNIINQRITDHLIVPFTDRVTKYELLTLFKETFNKKINIVPTMHPAPVSENIHTNLYTGNLKTQLAKLKKFYIL